MDSHGRRVYGVDERTYERELKTYFHKNFEDRVSERERGGKREVTEGTSNLSNIAKGGINVIGQIATVLRLGILVFTFYMLYAAGKKFFEELEKAGSSDEQEGDLLDLMFGSEFKGKFENSRQNSGVFQRRQEELRLMNLKDENNTTPPEEVRKIILCLAPPSVIRVKNTLTGIVKCTEEQYVSGHFLPHIIDFPSIFRIVYRGYTYRELLSPKLNNRSLLVEASSYISQCITT